MKQARITITLMHMIITRSLTNGAILGKPFAAKSIFPSPSSKRLFGVVVFLSLLLGCDKGVIEGTVLNVKGETLPGVVVTVEGGKEQDLTDVLGRYRLRVTPGKWLLRMEKTGFTTGWVEVPLEETVSVEAVPAVLWALPPLKGVYLLEEDRYIPLARTEPESFLTAEGERVFGTQLKMENAPRTQAPDLICHRTPRFDARMNRLERKEVLVGRSTLFEAWVATDTVPVTMRPVDDPEALLTRIEPQRPLVPGAYVVHWGALDGTDDREPRLFFFYVDGEPEQLEEGAEDVAADESAGVGVQ